MVLRILLQVSELTGGGDPLRELLARTDQCAQLLLELLLFLVGDEIHRMVNLCSFLDARRLTQGGQGVRIDQVARA